MEGKERWNPKSIQGLVSCRRLNVSLLRTMLKQRKQKN